MKVKVRVAKELGRKSKFKGILDKKYLQAYERGVSDGWDACREHCAKVVRHSWGSPKYAKYQMQDIPNIYLPKDLEKIGDEEYPE